MKRTTILIIEDDRLSAETLAEILEINGYRPVVARNAIDGLKVARAEFPSLIITDLMMPGMSGFGLLEALREDSDLRGIPVIVVSGKDDRTDIRKSMNLGAADFIGKPFTAAEVILSVSARLEKKELVDELDAFAHTVAHDLGSPLAVLLGKLEVSLMLADTADTKTLKAGISDAHVAAFRLKEITEELMVLSGVRRQAVSFSPLEMGSLVREAMERMGQLITRTSAHIVLPSGWAPATGHAPWITEVWVNYLSNAAKYGGPSPRITLGSGKSSAEGFSRYWVKDHGPGISPEKQGELFIPFTGVTGVRTSGHGLGLSIVRRIVDKHGGRVGVETAVGVGSTFWFELPAA